MNRREALQTAAGVGASFIAGKLRAEIRVEPEHEAAIPLAMIQKHGWPRWNRGFFTVTNTQDFSTSAEPNLRMFDRNGKPALQLKFQVPDASITHLIEAEARHDGSVVVAGTAAKGTGELAAVICSFNPEGKPDTIVRTNPFCSRLLAVHPDEKSVWAFGDDLAPGRADGEVFRRFGFEAGETLHKHSLRSTFQTSTPPAVPLNYGPAHIRSSSYGVVAYVPETQELIEFKLDGSGVERRVVARVPAIGRDGQPYPAGATEMTGLVITDRGEIYASFTRTPMPGIFRLNRQTSRWMALPYFGGYRGVHGREGNFLIARRAAENSAVPFCWFHPDKIDPNNSQA